MTLLKNILSKCLAALGILCMITVVFSITARDRWWIRMFDYPREQIAIVSIVVLLLSLLLLRWNKRWVQIYLVLLALAVTWQGYLLHPYFLPVPPDAPARAVTDSQRLFKLLIANVLMENQEVDSFLDLVKKNEPDLVLVIEPNAWWTEQLAPLRERYKYHIEKPQENHYGMNLYSRFALSETEINYFEETNTPSIYTVLTLPSGDEVDFYGVHPRPPLPSNSVSGADKELIKIAERVKDSDRPTVVAGDFNDVPWSFTVDKFKEISQLRDTRVGRGFYNTFDAKNIFVRLPIDHIFISPGLGLEELAKPMTFSSDHMALFTTLVMDAHGK